MLRHSSCHMRCPPPKHRATDHVMLSNANESYLNFIYFSKSFLTPFILYTFSLLYLPYKVFSIPFLKKLSLYVSIIYLFLSFPSLLHFPLYFSIYLSIFISVSYLFIFICLPLFYLLLCAFFFFINFSTSSPPIFYHFNCLFLNFFLSIITSLHI